MRLRGLLDVLAQLAFLAAIPGAVFVVTLSLASSEGAGSATNAYDPTARVAVRSFEAPVAEVGGAVSTSLPANRASCDAIRGATYRSDAERDWFLQNCVPRAEAGASGQVSVAPSTGSVNANAVRAAAGSGPGPIFGTGDRLVVARLGINAPVNGRTVGTDGVMGDPAGPTDVVWYDFSALGLGGYPGEGGNAVFAGHVDYRGYGPAAFYQLRNVQQGDIVEYHTASGGYFRYQVVWFGDYAPDADWASLVSGNDELTMITCNGAFDSASREYSHRRVVRAVRIT